jgi:hypothetical protein
MMLTNNNRGMETVNCAEMKHDSWFSRLMKKFHQKPPAEKAVPVAVFPVDESSPFYVTGWDIR